MKSAVKENSVKRIIGDIYLRLSNQGRPLKMCPLGKDLLDEMEVAAQGVAVCLCREFGAREPGGEENLSRGKILRRFVVDSEG